MRTFKKYRISTNYVNHAKVEIQKCVMLLKHFRSSTDFFFFFLNELFFIKSFQKCLKIYQLNITKITKKDYKENLVKNIKVFLKKKHKKEQYGCEQYKNLPKDEK